MKNMHGKPNMNGTFLTKRIQKQQQKPTQLQFSQGKGYMRHNIKSKILSVCKNIAFVVTNETLCPYGALIYGALQMKGLLYTQYGKYICSF